MHAQFKVRQATLDDIPGILSLDQRLFQFDFDFDPTLRLDWSHSPSGFAFYQNRILDEGVVFLAENHEGKLLGFITGGAAEPVDHRIAMRKAELDTLFVLPEARGLSLGYQLVQAFFSWCSQRGFDRLSVRVSAGNARAITFYRQHGFEDYDLILERPIEAQ